MSLRCCVVAAGLIALFATVGIAQEESAGFEYRLVSTDGVLASVPVPTSWEGQYNSGNDVVVLLEPGQRQVMLFPYAGVPKREAVAALLRDLGGEGYADRIREIEIDGVTVASIQLDVGGESLDWVLAAERSGIILAIWARTSGSLANLEPIVRTVVARTEVAQRRRPQLASGTYSMPSDHSITLRPDGEFRRELNDSESRGVWEMRGERLLLISQRSFSNMRASVGEEAITIYGADGNERQWERR